jgi:hypothetical protein
MTSTIVIGGTVLKSAVDYVVAAIKHALCTKSPFEVPARPHPCGKPAAYRTLIYFDRGYASRMEQFRDSLIFRLE